jgi:hypothetical protein
LFDGEALNDESEIKVAPPQKVAAETEVLTGLKCVTVVTGLGKETAEMDILI